jgi:tetratricopeptide (TPR) repeat protein
MSTPAAGGDKKNIVKMAYIYFQEGRWDKAIEEYKKLIVLDPEDVNTHNMLGDVYVKKGSASEAFDAYSKVSADYSTRGQVDKAAVVNKKIAALDSSKLSGEAQKKQNLIKQGLKAEGAMESGDLDSAIDALSEALKLDPENLSAYTKLAELYEKKGKIPEAIQQYLALGSAFLKNRLFKKAQDMFQKIVLLDSGNLDARINLAQIFIKQGSESDAKKEFLMIAELAQAQGDIDKALLYANKAIEFKSIEAHFVLGLIFFKKQQFSEAKAEFESLLRFKVNHAGALIHLGLVLMEQDQLDKAAESIQKALKVEKDNLSALEAMAEISLKKGSKSDAINSFNTLIGRYDEKGLLPKALEIAQKVIALDENAFTAKGKLGDLLKKSGQKEKAAEVYLKAAGLAEKQNQKPIAEQFSAKARELGSAVEVPIAPPSVAVPPPLPQDSAPPKPAPVAVVPSPTAPKSAENVLDLEDETPAAAVPAQVPVPLAKVVEDPLVELDAQLVIADNYLKQNLAEEAIEIYQQLLESYPQNNEIRAKLNLAYTAYVKTGDEVIGVLEAEKKAKEDEDRRMREEMERKAQEESDKLRKELEQKAREEEEKNTRAELEKNIREETEKNARAEMEKKIQEETVRKVRAEMEQKVREEMERKIREETEQKVREETENKIRLETELKLKEEMQRRLEEEKRVKEETEKRAMEAMAKLTPKEPAYSKLSNLDSHAKTDSALEDTRDEFMTIAVADIYTRQGLYEEARKIFQRIVQLEPDNFEAKKKLEDVENIMKLKVSKGLEHAPAAPLPVAPAPLPAATFPAPSTIDPEKDSGGKKKSNRVGYV